MDIRSLTAEEKLAIREAQHQANRLKDMAEQAKMNIMKEIEKLAAEMKLDINTVLFDIDQLKFVEKK